MWKLVFCFLRSVHPADSYLQFKARNFGSAAARKLSSLHDSLPEPVDTPGYLDNRSHLSLGYGSKCFPSFSGLKPEKSQGGTEWPLPFSFRGPPLRPCLAGLKHGAKRGGSQVLHQLRSELRVGWLASLWPANRHKAHHFPMVWFAGGSRQC